MGEVTDGVMDSKVGRLLLLLLRCLRVDRTVLRHPYVEMLIYLD